MIVQGLILLSCVFGLSRPHITTFCVFGESLWITPTLFIINNRHLYQNIRRPSKLDIHICGPRPEPTYYVCFQAQELCKEWSNHLKPLCIFSSILWKTHRMLKKTKTITRSGCKPLKTCQDHAYTFWVGVVEDRSVLMGLPDGSHGPNGSCRTIVV